MLRSRLPSLSQFGRSMRLPPMATIAASPMRTTSIHNRPLATGLHNGVASTSLLNTAQLAPAKSLGEVRATRSMSTSPRLAKRAEPLGVQNLQSRKLSHRPVVPTRALCTTPTPMQESVSTETQPQQSKPSAQDLTTHSTTDQIRPSVWTDMKIVLFFVWRYNWIKIQIVFALIVLGVNALICALSFGALLESLGLLAPLYDQVEKVRQLRNEKQKGLSSEADGETEKSFAQRFQESLKRPAEIRKSREA